MNLILKLSNPDILPETLRTRQVEFGSSGGTIGRHPDCDWVLDDPERFVSSNHAIVVASQDGFQIQDVSTNGTFLNDVLIGKGNSQPIKTGDTLRVGRFIMTVEHRDEDGKVKGEEAEFEDPFEFVGGADTDSLNSVEDLQKTESDLDSFLGAPSQTENVTQAPTSRQHVPGIQDALPTMRVADGRAAIPEEWWQKDPEEINAAQPRSPEADQLLTEQKKDDLLPETKSDSSLDDFNLEGAATESSEDKVEPEMVQRVAESEKPAVANTRAQATRTKSAKPKPRSQSRTVKRGAPKTGAGPGGDSEAFVNAFFEELAFAPEDVDAHTGQVLGTVMREMLGGSLDLLGARTKFRSEMRMATTMIGVRENNPLKFSINHQDALDRLLKGEGLGFMKPVEATKEMMQDLREHQLAMVAGMNAGIRALLAGTDPSIDNPGKNPLAIPGLLNKLKERHKRLVEQTTERMDGVYWRAFAQAYETTISAARRARNSN